MLSLLIAAVIGLGPQQPSHSAACEGLRSRKELAALAAACEEALQSPQTLPNLICKERVQRYLSPGKPPDNISADLRLEKLHTFYTNVTVNGKIQLTKGRTGNEIFEEQTVTTGEFAGLFNVFDQASRTEFKPSTDTCGRGCLKYWFRVERQNNKAWTWSFIGSSINPGYHGSISVNEKSGAVQQLVLEVDGDEVDPETPVSKATTSIEYSDVETGSAGVQHVPFRGENISCFRAFSGCVRETFAFSDFHKFAATSKVLP